MALWVGCLGSARRDGSVIQFSRWLLEVSDTAFARRCEDREVLHTWRSARPTVRAAGAVVIWFSSTWF